MYIRAARPTEKVAWHTPSLSTWFQLLSKLDNNKLVYQTHSFCLDKHLLWMHILIPDRQSHVKIVASTLHFTSPGTGFCQFCCLAAVPTQLLSVSVIRTVSKSRHKQIQLLLKSESVSANFPILSHSFTSRRIMQSKITLKGTRW